MKDQYIWKKYLHLIWIKANDRIALVTTQLFKSEKCFIFTEPPEFYKF